MKLAYMYLLKVRKYSACGQKPYLRHVYQSDFMTGLSSNLSNAGTHKSSSNDDKFFDWRLQGNIGRQISQACRREFCNKRHFKNLNYILKVCTCDRAKCQERNESKQSFLTAVARELITKPPTNLVT